MSQSLSSERTRERERLAHKKCVNPGVIFGPFGVIVGHFGSFLGHFGSFWVILGPFWAIWGHIWATLGHFGSFLAIFGPFCGIFGQICGKFNFFCGIVGVARLAFRMYALPILYTSLSSYSSTTISMTIITYPIAQQPILSPT